MHRRSGDRLQFHARRLGVSRVTLANQTVEASSRSRLLLRLIGFAPAPTEGLAFVDYFLLQWDRFAQGKKIPDACLGEAEEDFEAELAKLLRDGDSRAPSRAVFYAVVQIGKSIDGDSELGVEIARTIGPRRASQDDSIFAGELYVWWQENRARYPRFRLFQRWERRAVSQRFIKMYEEMHKTKEGEQARPDNAG